MDFSNLEAIYEFRKTLFYLDRSDPMSLYWVCNVTIGKISTMAFDVDTICRDLREVKWWEDTIWIAIENPPRIMKIPTENTVGGAANHTQSFWLEKIIPKHVALSRKLSNWILGSCNILSIDTIDTVSYVIWFW